MSGTAAWTVGELVVRVHASPEDLAVVVADEAGTTIRRAVEDHGRAHVMLATGRSQIAFLEHLTRDPEVPWDGVTIFHMDEYLGMSPDHPASLARFIRERVVDGVRPGAAHYLDGTVDPAAEAARYAAVVAEHPLDLCVLGIGENGHLAFNDPPVADFADPVDVKVVELDVACRFQQVGEGHFREFDDVPTHALTVTIPALLRAARVLALVPEARKAEPVRRALTGPITEACPASALRTCGHAELHLDPDSAARVRV